MVDQDYAASTKLDYPSLSYLRERMLEAEIVPIFATTGNLELYTVSNFAQSSKSFTLAYRECSNVHVPDLCCYSPFLLKFQGSVAD